jgi:RNA polymerase sigma-70 factor (ECF subfamily)
MISSDEALMLEFQRGSREAFAELYARYREPLFGFFRRRLASRERAEDLAQETFLAVIRAVVRYEPRAMVKTYLYSIALKLLAAERRKLSRNEPQLEGEHEPAQDSVTEQGVWVKQAVEKLETGEREILMLREYEQLSYEEIAELLRLPVNTVRSRLFRARMALKELLEPKRGIRNAGAKSAGRRTKESGNYEQKQSSDRTRRAHGLFGRRTRDRPRGGSGGASGALRRVPRTGGGIEENFAGADGVGNRSR